MKAIETEKNLKQKERPRSVAEYLDADVYLAYLIFPLFGLYLPKSNTMFTNILMLLKMVNTNS